MSTTETSDVIGAVPPASSEATLMTQMLAGFQVSQALYVVAKLNIATKLAKGPRPLGSLAEETGADEDALRRLLRTLAPLGLFRHGGHDTVEVTSFGELLSASHPASLRDAALYWMETHYQPFNELLGTVTTGKPAAEILYGKPFFEWLAEDSERAALLTGAMANVTSGLRAGMFDGYALPKGQTVADIGGADGTVMAELLGRDTDRQGVVFDLPHVVSDAHEVLRARGLADRIEVVGGDFFDGVPTADVYVLSYILHDWDDASCGKILGSIARAASPGARLVVIEAVLPEGDAPHLAKMIDLTMLAMLTGRERTAEEYEALLSDAGFAFDRILPTPSPFSVIEATLR
ncbi:methyltransferase [Streptomyces flaveus]|uniref:Hydroxyneurosporene-O-methyltransferase n=1 Tax=Streptomyces flaveus TaxID=66370 RepID=A0A917VUI5_9ACTN|nr:methyltransferase [Streptomyces flaveus]GGL15285.1 hydroxyneurosporene-O-methyltransferase [Streptomyces flaveus]